MSSRTNKPKGYWIPVLHAHLPFVRHPEHEYFLEEQWLFEAVSESYIPLLMNMERLVQEKEEFRLTISLSPTLLEMFSDEMLKGKYIDYLNRLSDLSVKEVNRLKTDKQFKPLAEFYYERYGRIKAFYTDVLQGDIVEGFRHYFKLGKIELITSCATHGFLPLLHGNACAVEAQVSLALDTFNNFFGQHTSGIWLPECAYYDGLDKLLDRYGLRYFFLDSHGLLHGSPVPRYGLYAPVYTDCGVAAFGRDVQSSRQVWSAEEGYPGDYCYRDFYRDAGFDLDFDYIRPYINPDGKRVFTGIKYYRITGKTENKEPYNPDDAHRKAEEHASHFCSERIKQAESVAGLMDRPPLMVSPYDAELFGHWWFEGPDFLYHIFKKLNDHDEISAMTPTEYLSACPKNQVIRPCPTSWGDGGFYDAWINKENDWIYRHLHQMADAMERMANRHAGETNELRTRCLNQLLRELLLAQSSDWAFLITTDTAKEYSIKRLEDHIANFNSLQKSLESDNIDIDELESLENKNSIFKKLDFRMFARCGEI